MRSTLSELLAEFEPDEWRRTVGFTSDLDALHGALFQHSVDKTEAQKHINGWIQRYQPCLFGRAAAAQNALRYCLITEDDIREGDEAVRAQIARKHLEWTREAFEGRSSGFVVLVLSRRVAEARPSQCVLEFAKILAQLYLHEDDVQTDQIYHDSVYLSLPGYRERVLKWKAGVNYFSAQADKRWWQDHRIPGGLGFSTNSVGHLAKSGKLLHALRDYAKEVGFDTEGNLGVRIESLDKALAIAMQTIDNASEGVSGRATELLPLPLDAERLPVSKCPFDLPAKLQGKNFCFYRGYYHTDFTLPADYFSAAVARPSTITPFDQLDFTYLFRSAPDNPAHYTMGQGIPIRGVDSMSARPDDYKRDRFEPIEVYVEDEPLLKAAL
jgi:hypothetical protein